jgi:hypothetical protein
MRGDGAPTGALFFRSRLRRATTRSRGDRDPSRRSTVAVMPFAVVTMA